MGSDDTTVAPERLQTDESLQRERDESDRTAEDNQSTEATIDLFIRRARDTADTVVIAAREKTDQRTAHPHAAHRGPSAAIVEERGVEDDALEHERASADESRRRERAEHARALSPLLPQARDKTNQDLLTERNRSDEALAHRDDFLGIVSHDLRNLLTAIIMDADRMKRLIDDIDDVANLTAGHLAFTLARGAMRRG